MENDNTFLDGWCRVGSTVLSDFYMQEADIPRKVTKIIVYPATRSGYPPDAMVETDGGNGGRPLRVDFRQWIRKYKPSI
jgi:hypothetical protein